MEDSGFADVFNEVKTDKLNLSGLKKQEIIINPLFNWCGTTDISLDKLADLETCLCPLFKYLSNPVIPKGNTESKIVFVADAPDDIEGEEGEKFFPETESGYIFEAMLDVLNLKRDDVYITTYVFCRDETRDVKRETVLNCAKIHANEFKHLKHVEYIFTLGTRPFQLMTGIFGNHSSFVGSYFETTVFEKNVKIIPLNSPAFLIDSEFSREKIFKLLEKIKP